jgi:3-deoxy-D-manno-octulosonic-acid transferase
MILSYRILTFLLYPFLLILIFFRKINKKEDSVRYKEKILSSYFNVKRRNDRKLIWFHAASIGEFKSIIPIIEKLSENKEHFDFLITTTTLSSSNLAKIDLKKFNNAHHRFIPFDVDFLMEKFFTMWKPDVIFLVDSEIWPNLIFKAKKYNIPIALINARLTLKSFNRWMLFPDTAKDIFNLFDLCLTSNIETQNFLKLLNAKNIYFHGNIKLINVIDEKQIININEETLKKNRFWIAASTHPGEEIFCLKTHYQLKRKYKKIITIIAPRHIERAKNIKLACEKLNFKTQLLEKNEAIKADKEIIIVNSFGVLQNYFKYAKSVFIGKSTIKKIENDSGQNPIDAAKLRCKIYHGPYVSNFKDIYEILEKNNISTKINTSEELSKYLLNDLKFPKDHDSKSSNFINYLGNKTLTATMKSINNFLLNEIK